MRPLQEEIPADTAPASDALVWPAVVTTDEILWLEPEADAVAPPAAPPAAPRGTSPAGLSLNQLVGAGVSMEWHDAVAIVSQLAHELLADKKRPPAGALPAVDAIRLDADGRLQVELDRNGDEPLAAGFGRVLQALLQDKPTPANLRLLAWRATSEAGETLTLDQITGELARWERPGRIDKLKDLYTRACAAGPASPAADSFEPVAAPPPPIAERPPVATPPPVPVVVSPRSNRQIALMAAGAIVCVALGGFGAWLFERPGAVAQAPAVSAPLTSETLLDIDLPVADRPAGRAAARSVRGSGEPDRQRTRRGTGAVQNPQRSTPLESPSSASSRSASSSASTPNKFANASARSVPLTTIPPAADMHLYKSGDPGVIEPVLVKPYLPVRPRPDIPDSALGVLELVVDARGLVESVHLKSPANRYREKWWLFTAKDWQFDPARKNGMPVRFFKRILLTDLNIAEPQ